MPKYTKDELIALLKCEVVPAVGCTEPIAVSYATAKATEVLGCTPEHIDVYLSRNVLKNAMGVGIPGTGMVGLPIAVSLGAIVGKSDYGLEVLKDVNPEAVAQAKRMVDEKRVNIQLKKDARDKLYIECCCQGGENTSRVMICGTHTDIRLVEKNGVVLFRKDCDESERITCAEMLKKELTFRDIYEFATQTPVDELRFILEAERLNMSIATKALDGVFGLNVGRTIQARIQKGDLSNDICNTMLYTTAAAVDARMAGSTMVVMSNSGSGNQGITATVPVVVYARERKCSEEQRIRALTLSHLAVIYIKMSLGRLAALCGCVVAASGSSAALVYLMGGTYEQTTYAIKNMVANITGMLCDGAKPSCALKVSTGTKVAFDSAILAMDNVVVGEMDGIIDKDIDQTIRNLTKVGSIGMDDADRVVLDIMTSK